MTFVDKLHKQWSLLDNDTYAFAVLIAARYPMWKTYFRRNLEEAGMKSFNLCIKNAQEVLGDDVKHFKVNPFQFAKAIREKYIWIRDDEEMSLVSPDTHS